VVPQRQKLRAHAHAEPRLPAHRSIPRTGPKGPVRDRISPSVKPTTPRELGGCGGETTRSIPLGSTSASRYSRGTSALFASASFGEVAPGTRQGPVARRSALGRARVARGLPGERALQSRTVGILPRGRHPVPSVAARPFESSGLGRPHGKRRGDSLTPRCVRPQAEPGCRSRQSPCAARPAIARALPTPASVARAGSPSKQQSRPCFEITPIFNFHLGPGKRIPLRGK